jgi:hypothetical protein
MIEHIVCFALLLSIFITGILFDRYLLNNYSVKHEKPADFFSKQRKEEGMSNLANKINIDDKKIVMGVETVNMESKHDGLGKTTESKDNTQSAINKLKNMKGK